MGYIDDIHDAIIENQFLQKILKSIGTFFDNNINKKILESNNLNQIGFYNIQKDNESWEKVYKNINGYTSYYDNINAYEFLHGYCNDFANCLRDRDERWTISSLHNEDGRMIHTYCEANINGTTYYADVRGVTSDFSKFAREFTKMPEGYSGRDLTIPTDDYEKLNSTGCIRKNSEIRSNNFPGVTDAINDFINRFYGCYSIESINLLSIENNKSKLSNKEETNYSTKKPRILKSAVINSIKEDEKMETLDEIIKRNSVECHDKKQYIEDLEH